METTDETGIEVYIDRPPVLLYWDRTTQWVYVEYRQWYSDEEGNIGIGACLKAIRDHGATKCLNDSRNRRALQPEAQRELIEDFISQAAALGLQRMAIVLPTRQVTLGVVETLVRAYRKYVETETFTTVEEAATWLEGKPFEMPIKTWAFQGESLN